MTKPYSQEKFLIDQKNSGKIPNFYSDEQCNFLQELLKDCLNPESANRPSAAQVSELLQVFFTLLEKKENKENVNCKKDETCLIEKKHLTKKPKQ